LIKLAFPHFSTPDIRLLAISKLPPVYMEPLLDSVCLSDDQFNLKCQILQQNGPISSAESLYEKYKKYLK
jgi:hypothetical protein